MKRAGVIGHPLNASLSPTIFQAAFDATSVEASYEAWATTPEQLEGRVNALRGDEMLGANVTIPHKEAVLPLLDRLDEQAERVGAVNTIAHKNGELIGYNTDVAGFDRAMREDGGFDPKGKRVAILGAGGAARAVALDLVEAGVSYVLLAGRTPKRLEGIVRGLRPLTKAGTTAGWCSWGDGVFLTYIPGADMVVNCTPVGTRGGESEGKSAIAAELLPADGLVFDLVYDPVETPLLKAAKERGAKTLSGLAMLVYQAAESFRIWTGKNVPADQLLEAGRKALAAER